MDESRKIVFTDAAVEPQIRSIVGTSKRFVTLVSAYLELWGHLKTEIQKAVGRGVVVRLVIRADEQNKESDTQKKKRAEDLEWLLTNEVEVYELESLHAKIYMNEKNVLVSSMNLTKSSINTSLEIAMIVTDLASSEALRTYVNELLKSAQQPSRSQKISTRSIEYQGDHWGKCIRCSRGIQFDPDRPLCEDCYGLWEQYRDPEYPERYCHSCGKQAEVSKARPLCLNCYRRTNPR